MVLGQGMQRPGQQCHPNPCSAWVWQQDADSHEKIRTNCLTIQQRRCVGS
jgi:hypothetical protein